MNERDIFLAAIDIADPDQRATYVERACGSDAVLRAHVQELLKTHEQTSRFLETPVAGMNVSAEMTTPTDSSNTESAAQREQSSDETEFRKFLKPSTRPGWLGRLGHYEIERILGRGAFGIVAKGLDEKLHRVVAIKLMDPELASTSPPRKRFLREARTAAAVTHENIVAIYAVEEEPIPYLVMEYIPGPTLQQRMEERGPLDVPDILRIGRQIAAGLAAAHAANLIHRDIKPSNILLTGGADERAKLTDFGLARAVDDASMTTSGLIAGTPMYMAPEQARGEPLDHRADLFSLGSVLYQMTSGRPPFRAANTVAVLRRVCEDRPRPIEDVIPTPPDWLCSIIFRLLEKRREDRYETAREVADLFARCQSELQQFGKVTCVGGDFNSTEARVKRSGEVRRFGLKIKSIGWLGGGLVAVAAILLWIMNHGKGPPINEVVRRPENTAANAHPRSSQVTDTADADRRVAELVLRAGGTVTVRTGGRQVELRSIGELPPAVIRVVTLKLIGAGLTDDVLARFEPLQELEQIELVGEHLTDKGVPFLTQYPRLRALTLACPAVSDEGLALLSGMHELQELNLGTTPVSAHGLRPIVGLRKLQRVSLGTNHVTAAHLTLLGQLPGLSFLQLSQARFSDADLKPLVEFPALRALILDDTKITDEALVHIQGLTQLRQLDLAQTEVSDEGLPLILGLKNLEQLRVSNTRVTATGVERLHAALPRCRITSSHGEFDPANGSIASPPATPDETRAAAMWLLERGGLLGIEFKGQKVWVDALAKLPDGPIEIHDLEASRCPALTDEALSQLAPGLKDLETLKGNNMAFDGTGFAAWREHRRLHTFASVGGGQGSIVSDEGLEQLARITPLKHLNCNSNRITDAGLAHLSSMPNLIGIELSNARITDAGLQHLTNMKHLRTLRLRDTQVTAEGMRKLRESLPHCNISY